MRAIPCLLGALLIAALLVTGLVHAQDKVTLRYAPAAEAKWQEKLSAELLETQLQGTPAGVTGSASAEVQMEVVAVDEAAGHATLQLTLADIKANLNGQGDSPAAPQPLRLQIDRLGCLTVPPGQEQELLDFTQTGGVPLQLLVILAHVIRFAEQPVAVGEEWTAEDTYNLPGMGAVPIVTRWKLMKLQENVATVASTAGAAVPDFKIPNPMAPGTQMDVRQAKVSIMQMVQEYDTKRSRVLRTEAQLRLDAKLDMGGFEMPVAMSMKYELEVDE